MASDDLNAPLGQDKRKRLLPKLPVSAPQLLAGALGLSGLVVVAWATFVHDPLGGEPIAVVTTNTPAASKTAREADSNGKQHARYDGPQGTAPVTPAPPEPPPGSKTVTIIDGSSGARQQVTIPGNSGAARRPCLIRSCSKPRAMARSRKLVLMARGPRPDMRIRANSRRIKRIHPSSPLSSAGLASAPQALRMHSCDCRRQ